jgi:hypothetical protein
LAERGQWEVAGFDLTRPGEVSDAEWHSYEENQRRHLGRILPTPDLIGRYRPDAVKRWVAQGDAAVGPGSLRTNLRYLHYYAIIGHSDGVLYEMALAARAGHRRAEVIDTLTLATLHSPSYGLHYMARRVDDAIARYTERDEPFDWPSGWVSDPAAFRSGMDFSRRETDPDEVDALRDWWRRVAGEVPAHVDFLAAYRPELLKANRGRLETAATALPKQMVAWLLLHFEVVRGHDAGIREAALMARGLGMRRIHGVDAIASAMLYAGQGGVSTAARAAADVFATWPDVDPTTQSGTSSTGANDSDH